MYMTAMTNVTRLKRRKFDLKPLLLVMCELRSIYTGIINQSSQSEQRGVPIWSVWYGSGHNPHALIMD